MGIEMDVERHQVGVDFEVWLNLSLYQNIFFDGYTNILLEIFSCHQ